MQNGRLSRRYPAAMADADTAIDGGVAGLITYCGEGPPPDDLDGQPGETYLDVLTSDVYEWE